MLLNHGLAHVLVKGVLDVTRELAERSRECTVAEGALHGRRVPVLAARRRGR